MITKSTQSKLSDKAAITIDDRTLQYYDHAELRRKAVRETLMAQAREILNREIPERRTADEGVLFKAMHAAAKELQVRKKRGTLRSGSAVKRLVGMFDDIRDHLFRQNIGLVYDMRRRSPVRGVDQSDLFSEGQWTLFRAIGSFNPWRGFKFSTYACRSILHAFRYVSMKQQRDVRRLAELTRDRGDDIESDRATLNDRDPLDVEATVHRVRRCLTENEAKLTSTERLIINERLLTRSGEKPATLESIGQLLNLSKERVRQLQIVAMEKLRDVLLADDQEDALQRSVA